MGIESLENAARAAGYAMAADEPTNEAAVVSGVARSEYASRQHDEFHDRLVDKAQATFADWVKGVVGVNGRSAPA